MSTFAEKIGLQDSFTYDLDIKREDLVSALKKNVDQKDRGFFLDTFDIFSSSKNEYKGNVSDEGFKIRKKRKFLSRNNNQVTATGTFVQQDKLYINIVISGVNYSLYILFFLAILFPYIILSGGFDHMKNPVLFIFIPIACIVHYFTIRKSITIVKEELKRELHYLTKK